MQAANEVGVPLKDNGYNGDLTAKQVGSVGGQMVNNICPARLQKIMRFERVNRVTEGHKNEVIYDIMVGV